MKHWSGLGIGLVLLALAACGPRPEQSIPAPAATPSPEPRVLRVMTYSSFSISEETVAEFEERYHTQLQFLDAGDTGKMLNQAILSKDNPQADLLYGLDNTFLSRALEADIFEPYAPKGLTAVPEIYRLDPQSRVVPVDFGDVCLNYDKAYFQEHALAVPQSLQDLTDPAYRDLLVVQNPASSSPGLAFLMATIGVYGDPGYLDYWKALQENGVRIVEDWDSAYYSEFSGGAYSEGVRPLVVSYATSPAAEVYFSEGALAEPPTGAVTAANTCFRQVEFAGILKNGQHPDLAQAFMEFLLSDTFQGEIPLQMWVFPVSRSAPLPEVFTAYALEAEQPVAISAEQIEQNREAWITTWADLMLR